MKVETVGIEDVRLLERNPRKHPEAQIVELVKSIEQFGQYRPLVVDEEGVILAGNGLYEALKRAGKTTVTIQRLLGLTESQKTKLVLADNKTGSMSRDDFAVVDELLRELDDFEIPGYDPDLLREMLGDIEDVQEQAEQFGILSEADRERLVSRSPELDEAREQVRVGTPPPEAAVVGTPQQTVPEEVKQAAGETKVCPTCRRAW